MIVAICGRKGTGKSTAGDYIAEQYSFKQYSLAQPLKDALKAMFGFENEQLYGDEKDVVHPLYEITPRRMLQTLGTEWGQHTLDIGRDIWVKRFMLLEHDPRKNYVISDVRFQHELDALKEVDELVSICLFRGGTSGDPHESEALALKTDYGIFNESDHSVLCYRLDEIMQHANHTKRV